MTRLWCFIGLPCSGKSYAAKLLAKTYNGIYISSGDIARGLSTTAELVAQTEAADLFPGQEEMLKIITSKIDDACLHTEHIFLDGFPRYNKQAEYLADQFWLLGPEVVEVNAGDQSTLWARARARAREPRDLDQFQFQRRMSIAAQNMTGVYEVLRRRLLPVHTIMSSDEVYTNRAFAKVAKL